MATGFNTQTGGGQYCLQFETDNEEYFLLMQELARCCVDHPRYKTNADKIRSMSDRELLAFLVKHDVEQTRMRLESSGIVPTATQLAVLSNTLQGVWMNWLQQPAEETK